MFPYTVFYKSTSTSKQKNSIIDGKNLSFLKVGKNSSKHMYKATKPYMIVIYFFYKQSDFGVINL